MVLLRPILLIIFINYVSYAQHPFIQNYLPSDFQGAPQTWDATQDNNGVMYFANSEGILIYDGIDWQLVRLPNKALAEDVCINTKDHIIYAAGNGNIGYLSRQNDGNLIYVSLLDKIDEKFRKFRRVLSLNPYEDGFTFISSNTLYIYDKDAFTCIPISSDGDFIYLNNRLYLNLQNGDLYRLEGQSAQKLSSKAFFGIENVKSACDFNSPGSYVVAVEKEVFISSEKGQLLQPFIFKGWNNTDQKKVIECNKLADNQWLFLLSSGGLLLTDESGNVKTYLDHSFGLLDRVIRTFQDRDNHLWVLTNHGISYIEKGAPFFKYSEIHGSNESILALYHHSDDQINYLGTSRGVYYLTSENTMAPIQGEQIINQIWNFENIHGRHLIATGYGVYELKNKKARKIISQRWVHAIGSIKKRKDVILFGTYADGLFMATNEKGKWVKKRIEGFNEEIRHIEEDEEGYIWISHYNKGVFRLKLSEGLDAVLSQDFYSVAEGLPSKENNRIFKLYSGELVVTTEDRFYHFNKKTNRFEPHEILNKDLPENLCIYNMTENPNGDIWIWAAELKPINVELGAVLQKQADNSFVLKKNPFYKIKKNVRGFSIDVDAPIISLNNGVTYFGKRNALIKVDNSLLKSSKKEFKVLFKQVAFGDSLYVPQKDQVPVFSYKNNHLNVDVSALYYEAVKENKYRFRLLGFDERWSEWSKINSDQFNNLPEGNYTLEVQAKNIYNQISITASLEFTILPPLIRTWYAYLSYILLFVAIIYVTVRWNTNRLRVQKLKLEALVEDRTKELTAQTEELFQMNEEINAQRNSLEVSHKKLSDYFVQIQDSISAGKIIQDALLPFNKRMQTVFEDFFILYKPKDIVSGDFYWLSKNDNAIYIAVIDCTGHGVPGAFMSLLAYSMMNETIEINKFSEPDKILNQLNDRVNYALGNKFAESLGGMDMCLCKIEDIHSGDVKVTFAGAKRPLYYIDNDELNLINGDRTSIGVIYQTEREFTSHEIILQKGSKLYLTTDGYFDMPNPERKKFGVRSFENLITEIHMKPLNQQNEILQTKIIEHRLSARQRDDITIIGVVV